MLGVVHLTHLGALQFACYIVLEVLGYDFVVFLLISQFLCISIWIFFRLMMIFFLACFLKFLVRNKFNNLFFKSDTFSSELSLLLLLTLNCGMQLSGFLVFAFVPCIIVSLKC